MLGSNESFWYNYKEKTKKLIGAFVRRQEICAESNIGAMPYSIFVMSV